METYFISHGSPALSIDDSLPARHFLLSWQQHVMPAPARPKAILVVSAHWETSSPTVITGAKHDDTIHDFSNFPAVMYELTYPAPGSPELAKRVRELLVEAGIDDVEEDAERGMDHGAWVPLMLMYPDADVPVVQLSVQPARDAAYHYRVGEALAPLREEGVLIMGSGAAVHNLGVEGSGEGPAYRWAVEFDDWLRDALIAGRHEEVKEYEKTAPEPKMAHPEPEHLYPLHVALGAAGKNCKAELLHHSWSSNSLSYASYRFSTP